MQTAIFAGGCFWCTEAIYQRVQGVKKVTPGYTGGTISDPTYEQVSSGNSGHAEAVKLDYDPKDVTYEDLLRIFWKTHDPTTLNRQGADVGTQYRSAIFYMDEVQKKIAEESLKKAQVDFDGKIVTQLEPAKEFYEAEDYHRDFYNRNRNYPYCRLVIDPKLQKLQQIRDQKDK